jgi:hypothetical protein
LQVKLFPGEAKFESQAQDTSWPVWNEEFKFQLNVKKTTKKTPETSYPVSQLSGYFISLTIYAILENVADTKKKAIESKYADQKNAPKGNEGETTSKGSFKNIMSSFTSSTKETVSAPRTAASKRRTIGSATWTLDAKLFQNDLKHDLIGTPDIWRPIEQLSTGVAPTNGAVSINTIISFVPTFTISFFRISSKRIRKDRRKLRFCTIQVKTVVTILFKST